jgi:hypothetical protein
MENILPRMSCTQEDPRLALAPLYYHVVHAGWFPWSTSFTDAVGRETRELRKSYQYLCVLHVMSVLRIRIHIHRIHVFLGLLYPDPDPLVRAPDPAPDPSIIKQK